MARPDLRTRQAKAAQAYVQRKGYPNAVPARVIQIEGDVCWYFYYDLPDGCLELEVAWATGGLGLGEGIWNYAVTAFQEAPDRMIDPIGR